MLTLPILSPASRSVLCALALAGLGVAQQPTSKTSAIAGRCTDDTGAPIERAKVEVYEIDHDRDRTELRATTLSGDDGSFLFDRLPDIDAADRVSRFYVLFAHRAGRASAIRSLRNQAVDPAQLELVLGPPGRIAGRVEGVAREPLAGTRVWIWIVGELQGEQVPEYWGIDALPFWTRMTGPDGRFEFEDLPLGQEIRMKVWHPLHAEEVVTAIAPSDQTVRLGVGATIVGRVRYPDGSPAAHVKVQNQGIETAAWRIVYTDREGRYRLESLPDDLYNVWAAVDGYTMAAIASCEVALGQENRVRDLELIPGGTIRGRVVDADGEPVQPGPTADVGLHGPSRPRPGGAIEVARIGADGTFEFRAAPGSNHIYLRLPRGWRATAGEARDLEVREGEVLEVTFPVTSDAR